MTGPALGGLAAVLPGVAAVLGLSGCADPLGLRSRLGDVRQVAVLLVDGFGYHLLPRASRKSGFLKDAMEGRVGTTTALQSSFPSTTPTSLVTLGTGTLPGEHGILGFTVAVPGSDRVLTHISWTDDPPVRDWQPVPSVLTRLDAAGIRTSVVSRPSFRGTGLTRAAYGDGRYVGASDTREVAECVLAELRGGARLVYGYHPSLDTAAHLHGVASRKWGRAARAVGRLVERVVRGMPAGTALVVTGDHGAIDVPADDRVELSTDPRLLSGVRVVAGEPRVRYLHTADGATADVLAAWRSVLDGRAVVLDRDDAIARGWYGPVRASHRGRLGDVVVVCTGRTIVTARGHEPDGVRALVGYHGGLEPEETAVPLMTFTR
jgi:hypothetical protein